MTEEKGYIRDLVDQVHPSKQGEFLRDLGDDFKGFAAEKARKLNQEVEHERQAELRKQYEAELAQARQGHGNYALLKVRIARKYREKGLAV